MTKMVRRTFNHYVKSLLICSIFLLPGKLLAFGFGGGDTSNTKILHQAGNLSPKVLSLAQHAYMCAKKNGYVKKPIVTIIDYSKPSTEKRMWVINLDKQQVDFQELVAHGQNSGDNYASHFSNGAGTLQSSIGVYVTNNTFYGSHGLALKVRGLDRGFNDNANSRAVEFHSADYVSEDFIRAHGRLGRSWGCMALNKEKYTPTINEIKNGTLVFAYYPNKKWLSSTPFLSC